MTGSRLSAVSGLGVTVFALVCAIAPPTDVTNVWLYESKLIVGTMAVIVSARLLYRRSELVARRPYIVTKNDRLV